MTPLVIYHKSDFDGIFCREIAKKFLPDAELIGWEYGEPEPKVLPERELYILDLSVPGLMNHPRLIWIDHHKSAIEKYPTSIPGYRIDGVAACRLAWQWFRAQKEAGGFSVQAWPAPTRDEYESRTIKEPFAVRLAGEYDIWDKRDPRADLFQHGLRAQELTRHHWEALLDTSINETSHYENSAHMVWALLERGEAVQYAKTQENAGIIKAIGFDVEWEGLKFLACNHAAFNSFLFTAGIKPEHDALLGFKWTGKDWSCSLYHAPGKEHHNLSLIAVKYGGGGHKGACGFRVNKLPFLK